MSSIQNKNCKNYNRIFLSSQSATSSGLARRNDLHCPDTLSLMHLVNHCPPCCPSAIQRPPGWRTLGRSREKSVNHLKLRQNCNSGNFEIRWSIGVPLEFDLTWNLTKELCSRRLTYVEKAVLILELPVDFGQRLAHRRDAAIVDD